LGGGTASAKTIDLRIEPKGGSDVTLSSIAKSEKDHIEEFLTAKKVRVKTEAVDEAMAIDLGSDDDDEEMQSASEEDVPKVRTGGDDDESSEGRKMRVVLNIIRLINCFRRRLPSVYF
jgi:hypothetical protein